jgi:hypothetical protein
MGIRNEISMLNLRPPQPGEVRNPNGRKKGSLNAKTIIGKWLSGKEFLTDENGALVIDPKTGKAKQVTQFDLMVLALIKRGRKGDVFAFNALMDRYDGKVANKTELTGDNAGPIILQLMPAPNCEPLASED